MQVLCQKIEIFIQGCKIQTPFLKTRRCYNRHKMLLIVPKIIFFAFYVLTSGESQKQQHPFFKDLQTTDTKELFSYEYFSFANNSGVMGTNMSLYALSKLKLRYHK